MHDFREQRADTFETFAKVGRGVKLPKTAVVVYEFIAEEVDTKWAAVEHALRAKGFKTHHKGDVLEARIGPITIDAETREISMAVSDAVMAERKAKWVQPKPNYTRGVLAKYAKLVSSASEGAVTDK